MTKVTHTPPNPDQPIAKPNDFVAMDRLAMDGRVTQLGDHRQDWPEQGREPRAILQDATQVIVELTLASDDPRQLAEAEGAIAGHVTYHSIDIDAAYSGRFST